MIGKIKKNKIKNFYKKFLNTINAHLVHNLMLKKFMMLYNLMALLMMKAIILIILTNLMNV